MTLSFPQSTGYAATRNAVPSCSSWCSGDSVAADGLQWRIHAGFSASLYVRYAVGHGSMLRSSWWNRSGLARARLNARRGHAQQGEGEW
jgi:hypothetical protein